ncbi:hypothetical protein [Martelella sp. HB161492]|uniref:hypothetical protein n=1 Tax=Martelella sp. HB161492 TaxID=2720726 RepID=UPI001AED83F0|nr:hypothetical protein [Martelella sp. HB161492]
MFEVDWKHAPKEARWWAMDADGKTHWYCQPTAEVFTTLWHADIKDAPGFGYDGDWKQSLRERPRGNNKIKKGNQPPRPSAMPNHQIKDNADHFERARQILCDADFRYVSDNGDFLGISMATINNAIVAVELYLKSLSSNEIWTPVDDQSGISKVTARPKQASHKLVKQLDEMEEMVRARLEEEFVVAFPAPEPTLEACLNSFEGVFQWSRYPFEQEQPKDFKFGKLMDVSEFLSRFVASLLSGNDSLR